METDTPPRVHVGSKGCQLRYANGLCRCPQGRCWVTEQRDRQTRGLPIIEISEWLVATTD